LYGDGVYETLRTYGGKVWQMEPHLKRLQKSAGSLRLKLKWTRAQLSFYVKKLVRMHGHKESRIRIMITRGMNGFNFMTCKEPTLLIIAYKLVPQSAKIYKNGVKTVIVRGQRILPQVKSTSLLAYIVAQHQVAAKKAYEGIFVDEKGFVREGTITNVFAVKNGVVFTPKSGILAGLTRDCLLKLMRKNGIKVRVSDFTARKLYGADEIFLTNTTKGIIPVSILDGKKIGTGRPGVVTKKIMELFDEVTYGK
jgi:branched-chain amino acid aminotransferase